MTRRPVRTVAWFAALVGGLVLLRAAGTGELAAPPVASWQTLDRWAGDRDAVGAAMALVRLVAELSAWYLLAVSALHVAATVLRLPGAQPVADALSAPGVARLLRLALGVGIAAAGTVTAGPATSGTDGGDHAGVDPDATPAALVERPSGRAVAGAIVQERLDAGTATMAPIDDAARGTARMAPIDADETLPSTWQVTHGESLWTIAADIVERVRSRSPTDAEIDPYWRVLIEANRDRLVDRDDPDLILPGQVFELPAHPG